MENATIAVLPAQLAAKRWRQVSPWIDELRTYGWVMSSVAQGNKAQCDNVKFEIAT